MLSILPNHLDLVKEFPPNFIFVVLQHSPDKCVFLCFEISVLCRQHYSYSIAYLVKFSMTVNVYCMTVIF